MAQKIYDLSPAIRPTTAVFPGDQAFSREVSLDCAKGDHLSLSAIQTTVHIGAHTDAPSHYHRDGKPISECDLSLYFGPCQVIEVSIPRGERVRPEHIQGKSVLAPRVLIRTGSFPNPDRWNSDFNSLSPELIHLLAKQGVKLVGIDTPSVDPETSKKLEAHQALYETKMANLEGIVLNGVPEGTYVLMALPLKIEGADASPVRAVLVKELA